MSGHSKWATTKRYKGLQDAKRGKIFTKYSKLIMIAVRDGGKDPNINSTLRMLINKAKKDGVPNDNIEKAIKAGAGELKDTAQIKETIYEAYGPGGIAILIETLSDNSNRTLNNIRTILTKNAGSLGNSGSVSYLFSRKGVFVFSKNLKDKVEEFAINNGAEDIEEDGEVIIVYTSLADYVPFSNNLHQSNLETINAELRFVPTIHKEITDKDLLTKVHKLVELLEEDDDVQEIHTNVME